MLRSASAGAAGGLREVSTVQVIGSAEPICVEAAARSLEKAPFL
jgi:hypothetical protein